MKVLTQILAILSLLFALSCGQEQFAGGTNSDVDAVEGVQVTETMVCDQIKSSTPSIDLLFLIDNSSSTNQLSGEIKSNISSLISQVNQFFDFHVVVANLLDSSTSNFKLVTDSLDGLDTSVHANIVSASAISLPSVTIPSASESGFLRTRDLIMANMSNGVFREGAYTLVVLFTNGTDSNIVQAAGQNYFINETNYSARLEELKMFSGAHPSSILHALQFRFITLVPHSTNSSCSASPLLQGIEYKRMSKDIYTYNKNNPPHGASALSEQDGKEYPDSHDLCGNLTNVFADVRNTIESLRQGHTYKYWPVLETSNASLASTFDPDKIEIFKIHRNSTGEIISESEINQSSSNGYSYYGFHSNVPIRLSPPASTLLPMESSTGFFVELHGNAKVTWPDCLQIKLKAPNKYFGYFALTKKPVANTIKIFKNGDQLSESSTNGWKYTGEFFQQKNLAIISPTNRNPASDAYLKSGYLIEMYGDAVYTNEDKIEVFYKPDSLD